MKRILTIIAISVAALSAVAIDFNQDNYHYVMIDGTNDVVCSAEKDRKGVVVGLSGDIEIPDNVTYNGVDYTVVALDYNGFKGAKITSVVIPNTVKSVKGSCFKDCTKLKSVTFGENVYDIGTNVFGGCFSLELIKFLSPYPPVPESDFMKTPRWNFSVFGVVGNKLTIAADKESILCYACLLKGLKYENDRPVVNKFVSFTSPKPIGILSDDDFEYVICEETKECAIFSNLHPDKEFVDFTVPDYVTFKFGDLAKNYKMVGIGTSSLGKTSFVPLIKASGILAMSDNIRFICDYAFFYGDTNYEGYTNESNWIEELVLPSALRYIGVSAFEKMHQPGFKPMIGIERIQFGKSLEIIRQYAFNKSLLCETLSIPPKLKTAETYAFGSGGYNVIELNEKIEKIDDYAFSACKNVTSVVLPSTVVSIGKGAFSECKSLENVQFDKGLKTIGARAFQHTKIGKITIPNSVVSVGTEAFKNTSLKDVVIEDGINPISFGDYAIGGEVSNLYFGRDFDMGKNYFDGFESLEIGNLVKAIPSGLCGGGVIRIRNLRLGSGLTSIGSGAFRDIFCIKSLPIIIPPKVKTIGEYCFSRAFFDDLVMGAALESIGENAFRMDCDLKNISITAPIPPDAGSNVFRNYKTNLFTDPRYSAGYQNPGICWSLFNQKQLIRAEEIVLNHKDANLECGDELYLTATVYPPQTSLPYVFWESSDPEVAIVDLDGKVTMVASDNRNNSCTIKAFTLYSDGPIAECEINGADSSIILPSDENGVEAFDPDMPYAVYNICGQSIVGDVKTLAPGIYIAIQNRNSYKIIIR